MESSELSRRDRLVDAALVVFAREGVDGASIKQIGQAAGVAPGLIYHYFPSKEALLTAAVERHGFLPELRELLAIPPERSVCEMLPQIVEGLYRLLTERLELVRVVVARVQTHPEMRARLGELIAEAQTLLSGYLHARVEAGELRAHASEAAARMLLSTVVMMRLTDAPPALLADVIDLLLSGLSAVPDRSTRDRLAGPPGRNQSCHEVR